MDEQDFRADIIDALNCYKKASEQNPQATLAALCQKHARESKVSAAVHPKDYIFQYVLKHPGFPNIDEAVKYYFDDGRRSADMLKATLQNDLSIDVAKRKTMLEFASGYGAVTRHLRAVLPMFDITSSDIHQAANDFIVTMLGEKAIQSSTVPELFDARGEYDLVFALSFFSHMPKETWRRWLTALYKPLCVGGHLIFTTHGAKTLSGMPVDVVLDDDGFCFRPESEQNDLETSEYGNAFVSNRFVIEQLEYLEHCELSLLRTGFWWGHQDLYVVTKLAGATSPPIVDSTVYRTDDKVHGYVDSVSIVEEKSPVQRRRILRATGWVSPDVTGNKSADRIIVLLRGDDGLQFSHEARRCERPDVVTHFHNPALLDTGFKVETDISALTEKLTLFLAIRSSDEAKLCPNVSIPLADWMRKSKPG